MFDNPYAKFDFSKPFTQGRSRNLFGYHTTPRDWKHGARDLPFGMGAKSLYVDGTNGHDSNDGESWITAKKTVQGAVDTADSWTQIFIKAGTYTENVTISKDGIDLLGEKRDTVIVAPASGNGIVVNSNDCTLLNLTPTIVATAAAEACITLNQNYNIVERCKGVASGSTTGSFIIGAGKYNTCRSNYCDDSTFKQGIASGGEYWTIEANHIENVDVGIAGSMDYSQVYGNEIKSCATTGILTVGDNNTICHNNLISNFSQINDTGSNNEWIENYYSNHTTDINKNGLCDTVYADLDGTTDYHPVSHRNGWKQTPLGHGPYDLQLATKAITLSTAAVPVTETLFTVTGEVEALITAYINTAVTSGGSLTLEAGIAGATAGLIAQTAVANLTIDKLWIDATPAVLVSKPSWKILANGGDIIHTIATAAATAGAITYYCWWKPLSADGKVVAA